MANWTNINDVMRDLSVAQGRNVPASLEVFGNTPPSLNIEEDSEDYFNSQGNVNFTMKPPDFSLIQGMISLVSDKQQTLKERINSSNLNPLSPEFIPERKPEMTTLWKKKACRNVALKSILEGNMLNKKPDVSKSPSSMFRKKNTHNIPKKSSVTSLKSGNISSKCEYIPTGLANEYYNKYMENTRLREHEDVATIEPVREICERRCTGSEKKFLLLDCDSSLESGVKSDESDIPFLLQDHRHLSLESTDKCIVCNITEKHGYVFKEEDINVGPWGDGPNINYVSSPSLPEDNVKED